MVGVSHCAAPSTPDFCKVTDDDDDDVVEDDDDDELE